MDFLGRLAARALGQTPVPTVRPAPRYRGGGELVRGAVGESTVDSQQSTGEGRPTQVSGELGPAGHPVWPASVSRGWEAEEVEGGGVDRRDTGEERREGRWGPPWADAGAETVREAPFGREGWGAVDRPRENDAGAVVAARGDADLASRSVQVAPDSALAAVSSDGPEERSAVARLVEAPQTRTSALADTGDAPQASQPALWGTVAESTAPVDPASRPRADREHADRTGESGRDRPRASPTRPFESVGRRENGGPEPASSAFPSPPAPSPAEPTVVRVTIGRVEVRAPTAPAAAPPAASAPDRRLSLDAYLRRRGGGG